MGDGVCHGIPGTRLWLKLYIGYYNLSIKHKVNKNKSHIYCTIQLYNTL